MNPLSVLLATVLLLAASTKLGNRFDRATATSTAFAQFVPEGAAVGAWRVLAVLEAAVGVGLLTFPASRLPAAVAAFMLLAASGYALLALKKAPDRPCGCFGAATGESVTALTAARALLLAATATTLATIGGRWTSAAAVRWWALAAGVEALALVTISPDVLASAGSLVRRRMPSCLTSYAPLETCKLLLARSGVWERLGPMLDGAELADHWRDGCWSFLSFRTSWNEEHATAVFAIRLPPGPRRIRATVLDDRTGRVLAQDHEVGRRRWSWLPTRRRSNDHVLA
jgi:hypothetical protein